MEFIPLLPATTDAPGPRTIAPTDISQYIRLDQCARYLRLRLHERAHTRRFMYRYGVAPQSIPPILTRSGADFERDVEAQIDAHTSSPATSTNRKLHCGRLAAEDAAFAGENHNALIINEAQNILPGAVLFVFQPRLQVTLGAWQLRGDVDILRLERDNDGALHVLITDMKSSTSAKVEHRLQVAFYHQMLATLFADADVAYADLGMAILYRGPAAGAVGLAPADIERQAEQRAQAATLFGVNDAFLELAATPDDYLAEVADLVTGANSTAAHIAAADFDDIPYHLSYKCDGCLYNEFCMKWSAETDDLSLLPHMADHEKNVFRAAGVTTTDQLASLKEFRSPETTDLITAPGLETLVRRLSVTPRVGARLDELIHRARRYRAWKGDPIRALSYIPSKGLGSLPYCDATHNPNLVRIYIDAQHDYLNDRIYMLGALVVACENGVESPTRRQRVVHLTDGSPADSAQEQALFLAWIAETIQAVGVLAAPDADGGHTAPIHLIFFNSFEQRLLLDGLSRHFGAIAAATPLYDFVTQLAAFDSPILSFLDQELRDLKNEPMVCPSLQAVAQQHGFDWNAPEPYRAIFRTRMFDDRGKLIEAAEGPAAWYTSRARFNSQIPLEYAYAAWGELPDPPMRGHDDFATYRGATADLLRGFHTRRLEAMEHITRTFKGNWQTEKTGFDLSRIASFSQRARTLADALDEFQTLEHHTKLGAWKTARLTPPERRVLAGETLILRYQEADQSPELQATLAENMRRRQLRAQYVADLQATRPGATAKNLQKVKQTETKELPITMPYRLRIDLTDVDCDLADALALTSIRPKERLILAPRITYDERLPAEQRQPQTPTAKQLLYGLRATLRSIDATSGMVEVELSRAPGGDWSHGYVFPTIGAFAWPLVDGERYTLDSDPNDWYGYQAAEVVAGLRAGQPNTMYARLAHPEDEYSSWPAVASTAQQRFLDGLDALQAAGALHAFDTNQRAYIAQYGAAPTLLVQGPPGTGKSYATAFALLARLQGALAADRDFRVFLSCKTHAATNVLLEKLVEVQVLLREIQAVHPTIFATFFDTRLLAAPLYRVRPSESAPVGATILAKGADELSTILAQRWSFVGVTPGGVYGMLKDAGGVFGQACCDCLVLDEASQMNLPEATMAALALKPDAQLIVVGDHRQMPPIVAHGWADERRRTFQEYRVYESLFVTLRERVPAPPMVKFAESFRLHADMAEFLRREIYAQDGIPYFSNHSNCLPDVAHADTFVASVLAPAYALIVVLHDEATSQMRNPFEQALITPLLTALADPMQYGLDHMSGLGVVVPHRAQRAALVDALPQLAPRDPLTGLVGRSAIDTVERFQGGERTAILVSATESDRDYLRVSGDFLLDPRRLNVALSRAKEKMILVASRSVFSVFNTDETTFANAQIWKNLLRRTCTIKLWEGERDGVRVEVWGNATTFL